MMFARITRPDTAPKAQNHWTQIHRRYVTEPLLPNLAKPTTQKTEGLIELRLQKHTHRITGLI